MQTTWLVLVVRAIQHGIASAFMVPNYFKKTGILSISFLLTFACIAAYTVTTTIQNSITDDTRLFIPLNNNIENQQISSALTRLNAYPGIKLASYETVEQTQKKLYSQYPFLSGIHIGNDISINRTLVVELASLELGQETLTYLNSILPNSTVSSQEILRQRVLLADLIAKRTQLTIVRIITVALGFVGLIASLLLIRLIFNSVRALRLPEISSLHIAGVKSWVLSLSVFSESIVYLGFSFLLVTFLLYAGASLFIPSSVMLTSVPENSPNILFVCIAAIILAFGIFQVRSVSLLRR